MTVQPRDDRGRWKNYRLAPPSVDDVCVASWEYPPEFATQEELVGWFLQQDIPDWAVRNAAAEYGRTRSDGIRRRSDFDTKCEMNRWDENHPQSSYPTKESWKQARSEAYDGCHARFTELEEANRPTSLSPSTARTLALAIRIEDASQAQFPGKVYDLDDLPVSTDMGDMTFARFVDQFALGMNPRCATDPSFPVTQAAKEAEDRVKQTTQRSIEQIIAESRARVAMLHDPDRAAEAEQRAADAERRARAAERESDDRAKKTRKASAVGAMLGAFLGP